MDDNEEWRLLASLESLKVNPERATLALRLGAAINAMRAAQRWFLAVKDIPGPVGVRDRVQAFLVATGHLRDAGKLLYNEKSIILELARRDGATEELIRSVDPVANLKSALQTNVLEPLRNKRVFHWDPEPFAEWAASYREDSVCWYRGKGDSEGEKVEWASLEAVEQMMENIAGRKPEEIIAEIASLQGKVIQVFTHAVCAHIDEFKPEIVNGSE